MSFWNPISWVRKEVNSPGPGPKREPFEKRPKARQAETSYKDVRNEEIDSAAHKLKALYGDKVVALGLLSDYEEELEDLKALETLAPEQVDRKEKLEGTSSQPGLISKERTRLYDLEGRIRSQERIARRRFPHNFDYL